MSRGNVSIHRPPLGHKVKVIVSRKIRQAVRKRLVEFGGTEGDQFTVRDIPERYVSQIQTLFATEYPEWELTVDDRRVVYREIEDNIAWTNEQGAYGSRAHNGYVGKMQLFSIGTSYKRDDPASYLVYSRLSGHDRVVAKAETERGAEKLAESLLAQFLESIGAQMKEGS